MRKNRSYIISLLFSSLLLLPLLLIIVLQLWQLHIKHRSEERLESRSLQTIEVAADKVKWEEEGREVTINGEFFDIKSYTESDGKYILTGVWDEQETAIKNVLNKKAEGPAAGIIQLLFLGQCFAAMVLFFFELSSHKFIKRVFGPYLDHNKYPYILIIAPPPRFLVCY